MSELKPCPFCGREYVSIDGYILRCNSCGAQGPRLLHGDLNAHIAVWNRRDGQQDAPKYEEGEDVQEGYEAGKNEMREDDESLRHQLDAALATIETMAAARRSTVMDAYARSCSAALDEIVEVVDDGRDIASSVKMILHKYNFIGGRGE